MAREPQSGGSRTLDAGGFLTGAKFLLVLETPKEATPEPWAEGQATEGVRSSSAAWVPGWPLASLRQELGPGDQPRGRVRPSRTLVVIYKDQLDSSDRGPGCSRPDSAFPRHVLPRKSGSGTPQRTSGRSLRSQDGGVLSSPTEPRWVGPLRHA